MHAAAPAFAKQIDLGMAKAFLDALEPNGWFTFQTYSDAGDSQDNLSRVMHGYADSVMLQRLARFNARGAGIFVTVCRTNGLGRKAEDIVRVRALFVDADDKPLPNWHLRPDLWVRRSDTRWHAYWLCNDMPLDGFYAAQKRLSLYYGTDPTVNDLPRVMRVPGYFHLKAEPVLVGFEDWRDGK